VIRIPIEILQKYAGKRIAVRAYASDPEYDYYAGDFLDPGMYSCVFDEVDTGESYFTNAGCDFFKEQFWNDQVKSILSEEVDVYVGNEERVTDPVVLLKQFNEFTPLLVSDDELNSAPFPILFGNTPRFEVLTEIKKNYGSRLDKYLEILEIRDKNTDSLRNAIDQVFLGHGFSLMRSYQYMKKYENHWLSISLNKSSYFNEFNPFISIAPISNPESKFSQPYHERHEMTKMYKLLGRVNISNQNSLIDIGQLKIFRDSLSGVLVGLSAEKRIEEEIINYIDKIFEPISLEVRLKQPYGWPE